MVVGTGIGGAISLLEGWDTLREKGPRRVSPHTITMLMPNGPAAWVGLELGAGPASTPPCRPARPGPRPSPPAPR